MRARNTTTTSRWNSEKKKKPKNGIYFTTTQLVPSTFNITIPVMFHTYTYTHSKWLQAPLSSLLGARQVGDKFSSKLRHDIEGDMV